MTAFIVCEASEIPPGARKLVTVKGRPIVIFNLDGEFHGLLNRCPHEGGSLAHGPQVGRLHSTQPSEYLHDGSCDIVRCPWHAWEFDIRTGKSVCAPEKYKSRKFNIKVEGGETILATEKIESLQVEKIDIAVSGQYLVIDA